jgi:capsular polysaccharide biosynthesis protein/Mrp family chromosome partitioning ATPase
MSVTGASRRDAATEERVDVRRYLDALVRSRWLIAGIVGLITLVVLIVSLALPNTYNATTRLVLEDITSAFGEGNAESTQRRLLTIETLLTARQVLDAVAPDAGESADELEDKISSSVDEQANIINITVSDEDPDKAARIANSVAEAFLDERTRLERERIARARENLEAEILRLEGSPNADIQIGQIRERISELTVIEGSAGADLQIAERAEPPSSPASPRPLRNTVLAFFGALFLGVLVALGRDQLTPRVGGPRELGRLLDVPVLAQIPYVRKRLVRKRMRMLSGVEAEAYGTLRAALELTLGRDERHVVLVTGAMHAEGKTTATARIGRALAENGRNTLIVSADLRVPRLHEVFDLSLGVGLSDLLLAIETDGRFDEELFGETVHEVMAADESRRERGVLHVVTSGAKAKDPGRLIAGPAMRTFVDEVRRLDYDYVLLDGPPLLGLADSQVLAGEVDDVLLVNRLDRLTLEHVADLREVLDRLAIKPVGVVVIGARGEMSSPYYLQRRPALFSEDEPQRAG